MGDMLLRCTLCCDKLFNNKLSLVEHLTNILANLSCPICNNKLSSLAELIEHLTLNNCQLDNTDNQISVLDDNAYNENNETSVISSLEQPLIENSNNKEAHNVSTSKIDEANRENSAEVGKMYVELLSKQLMKPCLQTQELKLVQEDGESRYVIMAQSDIDFNSSSAVVTKQNSDGTISLTAVKDMKILTDSVITQTENESEENQEEMYSCNTCGVSFSSVLEHVQNYHNDQDVVVEEPIEGNTSENIPIDLDDLKEEETTTNDTNTPRRMITETGDIVEAPLLLMSDILDQKVIDIPKEDDVEVNDEVVDKLGQVYTRRYVQIDKLCDRVVKDKKKNNEQKGAYHKVVLKEMEELGKSSKLKVFKCVSCNIYVSTLEEFKLHPCKIPLYKCTQCSVTYENSKSLCAHMKVHKLAPADKYKCKQCYVTCENSKSLCAHMKVHKLVPDADSEVPGPFKCEICNTVFPSNKSLKLHKRMHDPIKVRPIEPPAEATEVNNDKFLCSICDKLIPIDYMTVHHNSHKTDNKFNCETCNRKFDCNDDLEMHMSVHNNDKVPVSKQDKTLPYNCLYCNRQFARPHEKVKHERIHTGEKPHVCEICGKSFRVSYCLTLHMRTHTGARPYACIHCGKRFKAHSVYNHHMLTHSDVRAYKCPYCPKAFKTSVQLAGHKNSHTKPFSCQHCNRPFASLYAVRVHTETHFRQNNLKFSCSVCGASYARAFALKDHIKQAHKQEIDNIDALQEGWILADNSNANVKQVLDKDLSNEINELEMTSNEPESVMVVP